MLFTSCGGVVETISGSVDILAVDETDVVVAVAITVLPENDDEDAVVEYRVADNDKGEELLELVGAMVIATGRVTEDEEGNKTIYVSHYQVVQEDNVGSDETQ